MAFPTSIIADITTTPTQALGAAGHNGIHLADRDEIIALATKMGIGASIPASGRIFGADGAGTSSWRQLTNADVANAAAIALSKIAASGSDGQIVTRVAGALALATLVLSLVNADIDAAAAIAITKLAHVGAGKVLKSNGSANVAGAIVNADVDAAAAIVLSKLANQTANHVVRADGSGIPGGGFLVNANVDAAAAIALSKLAAGGSDGQVVTQVAGALALAAPASTMTLIGSTTLGVAAANIDFTSIPNTYKGLVLWCICRSAQGSTDNLGLRVGNGSFDTGSNYDWQQTYSTSSSVLTANSAAAGTYFAGGAMPGTPAPANNFQRACIQFIGYALSGTTRDFICDSGCRIGTAGTDFYATHNTGGWRSTSVIDRIRILATSGSNLIAGSTAYLFGWN